LIIASKRGHIEIVRMLVEKGADINVKDKHGNTALMHACLNMQVGTAFYLIDNGADLTITNDQGKTAMDIASKMRLDKIMERI